LPLSTIARNGLFCLFCALSAGNLPAQTAYPQKAIRLIVGFPPGSLPDIVARLLGL
jgi:tripartite-type tricarboxylate transporter receptor subunit TctC